MTGRAIAYALAALLGLGVPRSFALLSLAVLVVLGCWGQRRRPAAPPWLLWCAACLVLFGLSYSISQVLWGVWSPPMAWLTEIINLTLLPAACLLAGWCLGHWAPRQGTRVMLLYILGGLLYVSLALALSRSPWWDLRQSFEILIKVPWGSDSLTNVRSVEQRGFLALGLLPIAVVMASRQRFWLALGCGALGLVAVHVGISTQSRIGWAILALACLPLVLLLRALWARWLVLGTIGVSTVGAITQGWLCDERLWLVKGFLQAMPSALWGGRQIAFTYQSCPPITPLRFGSIEGASASLAHNVVLDVYNDVGLIPFLFLLLAVIPLAWKIGRGLVSTFQHGFLTTGLLLRWSLISVVVMEWLIQPFLYSDQLMFTIAFLFGGYLLGECLQTEHAS